MIAALDAYGRIGRARGVARAAAWFAGSGLTFTRIGLEAGPLSQWLHAGLMAAGLVAILIETRHQSGAGRDEGED